MDSKKPQLRLWQVLIWCMFMIRNSIALTSIRTTTTSSTAKTTTGANAIINSNININRSNQELNDTSIDRRGALAHVVLETAKNTAVFNAAFLMGGASAQAASNVLSTSSTNIGSIADRLSADRLTLPPLSTSARGTLTNANELVNNGIDNLYYPSWLSGTWDATQTLVQNSTPLGLKYIGGPNGSESIAAQSLNEQNKQLNVPVSLKLRYAETKLGTKDASASTSVAEDRLFNTKQRLDAFAGRTVVSSVEYADVNGSNRSSVLAMGGDSNTPLQTTVVRFKGPAAQKSFLIGHNAEVINENQFVAYEVVRSIFALTNTNTAPPVTTDTELVWSFTKIDDEHIDAKLRIASYLNAQSDKLYFEAKNQAVSIADYELKLRRST